MNPEAAPELDMSSFELGMDFDINAAFQEAMHGVATDQELELEEKVRRMEVIVSEGTLEVYRDFVDFRAMAAQVEMFCNHDHMLNEAAQNSETLSGFMDTHSPNDSHSHPTNSLFDKHKSKDQEIDPKTGKKKKKKGGWLGYGS